jgi:hypothetical protein
VPTRKATGGLVGIIGCLLLVAGIRPATAGQWVVDRYVGSGNMTPTQHYRDPLTGLAMVSHESIDGDPDSSVFHNKVLPGPFFQEKSSIIYGGWDITLPADTFNVSMTVHAVFKWVGDGTPTKHLAIGEQNEIGIIRTHRPRGTGIYYSPEHTALEPYSGAGFDILSAQNGFKDPLLNSGHTDVYSGNNTDYDSQANVTRPYHLTILAAPQGKTEFNGPKRTLSVSIAASAWTFGPKWYDRSGYATCSAMLFYKVTPATIGLKVRRKGTTETFQDSTSIAAGGKASDEHFADVEISAFAPLGPFGESKPLTDSFVPPPIIENGEGYNGVDAEYSGTNLPFTDNTGRVIIGEVRSSDKILQYDTADPTSRITLKLPLDLGFYAPKAYLDEIWCSVLWKSGQNGEKPYNSTFLANLQDFTNIVWTQCKVFGDKPLKNHDVKYIVSYLLVREIDPITQVVTRKTFTTDLQIHMSNSGIPGDQSVYQENIDALVAQYISLPPAGNTGVDGIYKGSVTIKYSPTAVVEGYGLRLQDQGVWRPQN